MIELPTWAGALLTIAGLTIAVDYLRHVRVVWQLRRDLAAALLALAAADRRQQDAVADARCRAARAAWGRAALIVMRAQRAGVDPVAALRERLH